MVIWIYGKSNSGKTLLAKKILTEVKKKKYKFIHIDGDEIRKITFNRDYSINGRYNNAILISNLVYFLNKNKMNIVVSTLSNFPKILIQNRKKIKNYFEIFINSNKKNLYKRDKRKVYFTKNKINSNVVGEDIKFKNPSSFDLKINNNGLKKTFLKNVQKIVLKAEIDMQA